MLDSSKVSCDHVIMIPLEGRKDISSWLDTVIFDFLTLVFNFRDLSAMRRSATLNSSGS